MSGLLSSVRFLLKWEAVVADRLMFFAWNNVNRNKSRSCLPYYRIHLQKWELSSLRQMIESKGGVSKVVKSSIVR
jgi:hypothetical protein